MQRPDGCQFKENAQLRNNKGYLPGSFRIKTPRGCFFAKSSQMMMMMMNGDDAMQIEATSSFSLVDPFRAKMTNSTKKQIVRAL